MQIDGLIWREVSRHLAIQASTEQIAAILREHVGVQSVQVWSWERDHERMTLLASGDSAQAEAGVDPVHVSRTQLEAWALHPGLVVLEPESGFPLHGSHGSPTACRGLHVGGVSQGLLVFQGPRATLALLDERAETLREAFAAALDNFHRLRELERLRDALDADRRALLDRLDRQDVSDGFVGAEKGLQPVLQGVVQVAPSMAPVLLFGETGTGKELVARMIHERSGRAAGPMVRVNCGSIPPDLVDSELFGHERGSFSGAVQRRRGWFERADGGTLFLDEVGELPPAAQVRLLRVLQDGTLVRVGGESELAVDVRIVAATHRDLEAAVAEGRFRQDLWFRLAVFPIAIPPLRERPSDIPDLARHFAWRAGRRLGGAPLLPSNADLSLLLSYDWPGNVRELQAVIERAAILGDGRRLLVGPALGVVRPPPAVERHATDGGDLETLDEANRVHIGKVLRATRGRIEGVGGAAEILGINPGTLRARMRRLGLDWASLRRSLGGG